MIKEKKDYDSLNINKDRIKALIEDPIKNANYKLVDINIFEEGSNVFLQIIVDKENGISLDDCVSITNLINPILDQNEDLFETQYILDICSKGVENNG